MIEFSMTTLNAQPVEWDQLWEAMRLTQHSWIPTTENMYYEMLEVLPPEAMGNGGFLVGEPNHHNNDNEPVYACFMRSKGFEFGGTNYVDTFKAQYLTVSEFNKM